jgi:hypothetical protein
MQPQPEELLSLVYALEKQNKRFRISAGVVLLLLAVGVLSGAARTDKHAITANEFVLQDDQGRTRASLSVGTKGAALLFFDEDGRKQLSLATLPHGHPYLALGAEDSMGSASISDGGLMLVGKNKGIIILSASASSDSPSVSVTDSQGYHAELGVMSLRVPSTGEEHRTSAASVVLLGKDQTVLWSAP